MKSYIDLVADVRNAIGISLKDAQPLAYAHVQNYSAVIVSGVPKAGGTVRIAPAAYTMIFGSDPANAGPLTLIVGTTSFIMLPGAKNAYILDGTPNGFALLNAGGSGAVGAAGASGAAGAAGATGGVGPAGPTGPKGDTGASGAAGPVGPAGATGASGAIGAAGPAGAAGPKGDTGAVGPAGAAGGVGPAGATGAPGAAGTPGTPGATGPAGAAGPTGPQGAASTVPGPAGATGPAGPSGATGTAGPAGSAGSTGPAGASGAAGATGAAGAAGTTGPAGATGTAGAAGPTGAIGATGAAGATGATGPNKVLTASDMPTTTPNNGDVLTWSVKYSKLIWCQPGAAPAVGTTGTKNARYWRLHLLKSADGRVSIAELIFYDSTGAVLPSQAAFASSALDQIANVNDGNTASIWSGGSGETDIYVGVDLMNAVSPYQLKIYNRTDTATTLNMTGGTLQYSADKTTWTDALVISGNSTAQSGSTTYNIPQS